MPVRLNAAEKKIVADAMKKADALIARTDKNKDGVLDEPELKTLMNKVEKLTKKMEASGDADASDPGAILRSKLSDADRTVMATMTGISSYADEHSGRDTIKVIDASKSVKKTYLNAFNQVKDNKGGLEGALGLMMAAMMLPKAALPLIAKAAADKADNGG